MKFLIDENLTPDLVKLFLEKGLNAYHVNELKGRKSQRIIDDQLRRLTLNRNYIIMTKDDDFVKSFVDRKVPEKLIYIIRLDQKEAILHRMEDIVGELPDLMELHDFIEINPTELRFPFSY